MPSIKSFFSSLASSITSFTPIRFMIDLFLCSQHLALYVGSAWILFFFFLSLYSVIYRFCWLQVMAPYRTSGYDFLVTGTDWRIGLGLLIASVVIKVLWLSSWLYALAYTWYWSRYWKPPSSSPRTIMQAACNLPPEIPFFEGRRPRNCPRGCLWPGPDGQDISDITDRVYHCGRLNRCLPCYDHFCPWIQVAVYSHTTKAYLSFIFWLILDCLLTIGVIAYSLSSGHLRFNTTLGTTVLLMTAIFLQLADSTFRFQHRFLARKNMTGAEQGMSARGSNPYVLAFKVREHGPEGDWILKVCPFDDNPWDLGTQENLRQTLGEWWQWPLFWIHPPRVTRYGTFAGSE
ncbi:hypothetical protein HD806DRAFT_524542 [Xylariaceae sp. AK1471]|nr:hypothetical protein HD806DRAFT_524542 [Xylariaceae sp. AK1471]